MRSGLAPGGAWKERAAQPVPTHASRALGRSLSARQGLSLTEQFWIWTVPGGCQVTGDCLSLSPGTGGWGWGEWAGHQTSRLEVPQAARNASDFSGGVCPGPCHLRGWTVTHLVKETEKPVAILPHTVAWGVPQARLEKGPPAACWWGGAPLPRSLYPAVLLPLAGGGLTRRESWRKRRAGVSPAGPGATVRGGLGAGVARVVAVASLLGSACPGMGVMMASRTSAWPRGRQPCPGRWGPWEPESPLGTLPVSDVPCG